MKYLSNIKFIARLPVPVAISLAVIVGSLIVFILALIFLGGARDDMVSENEKLKTDTAQIAKNLNVASDDAKYVLDNLETFEHIMQTDRLVPHTRRNAVTQLESLARQRGLDTLTYNFFNINDQSLAAVKSQPKTGGYKVSVEEIDLQVGAALDMPLYQFMDDLADSFPGAAVIQQFDLSRLPAVTPEVLDRISRGAPTGLVSGKIRLIWRTAQAVDPEGQKK